VNSLGSLNIRYFIFNRVWKEIGKESTWISAKIYILDNLNLPAMRINNSWMQFLKTMNRIEIIILIIFLNSCNGKIHPLEDRVDEYYYISFLDELTDTIKINGILQPEDEFEPIDSFKYWINNMPIEIIKLSNEPAPTDGGMVAYWEKSVGIFYQKSTTWEQFFRLESSNDSVNDFINNLYGLILLHYNFDSINSRENDFKYTPPIVMDTNN